MKISATIITCDEERNIARAIESLRCCDEILVVDSGSVDRTVEIAAKLGARVIESPWPGYAKQKNLAASKAAFDWIFSLDADEALSEALEAEIWQLKKNGPEYDAYTMPRMAQYLGRWILHSGWYPDRKVRLYDRRKANWVGDFVHESVQVEGSVGHLKSNLLHSHVRIDFRAPENDGPVYDARGAGGRVEQAEGGLAESDPRAYLDVPPYVSLEIGISGRPRGPHDRLYGRDLHVFEIRQSEEHELVSCRLRGADVHVCARTSGPALENCSVAGRGRTGRIRCRSGDLPHSVIRTPLPHGRSSETAVRERTWRPD